MSYKKVHSALVDAPFPAEWNENERWLFRHLAVAATLLLEKPERYRKLLSEWESEGPSEKVAESALFEAGALALVLQSARRRPEVLAAASETPFAPMLALGALDQLFYSFTLLTSPSGDDEYADAKLSPDELDEFLENPKLEAWLDRMAADAATRSRDH